MSTVQQQDTTGAGHADGGLLVEPEWLVEHLNDPSVRIVEVDVSPASYSAGHIEGAVLWNVYTDLKDANYEFVGSAAYELIVRRSGISDDSTVVFYGYAPAIGVWLMTQFGHRDARILNCSRTTWQGLKLPLTDAVTESQTTEYRLARADSRVRATLESVRAAIGDGNSQIIDVRSEAEYRGERFWPSGGSEPGGRPGHVPSAQHVPIDDLLDERGAYREPAALREVFALVDHSSDGPVITYCTVGGRAATAWFVLSHLLGRRNVRVFDGSWAQWGRTPSVPVECP